MIAWIKSEHGMRQFNGLVKSVRIGNYDYGIFEEKHCCNSNKYSFRMRPPNDSWGHSKFMASSQKKIAEHAEKYITRELSLEY